MDQELLVIELLSAENQIKNFYHKLIVRNASALFLGISFSYLFFFVIGNEVYQHLLRILSHPIYLERLGSLHQLSMVAGMVLITGLVVFLMASIYKAYLVNHHFGSWLEKRVPSFLNYSIITQDQTYYYFSEKAETAAKFRLKKKDCFYLTDSLDDLPLFIGKRSQFLGLKKIHIFQQKQDLQLQVNPGSQDCKKHLIWELLVGLSGCFALVGVCYYATRDFTYSEYQWLTTKQMTTAESVSETKKVNAQKLLIQSGPTPTQASNSSYELRLSSDSDELFMTTDSGETWNFVPIKPTWLRFDLYQLTEGDIPYGEWMDKTFELSADFSWFIYSPSEDATPKELTFLSSRDNGKSWQSHLIDAYGDSPIRYRKATFYSEGDGLAIYSVPGDMSEESLVIYTTNDFGETWNGPVTNTIPSPIQNVSFLNATDGFVATREKIYYTHNGGLDFKESLITLPDNYALGGWDVFQSPNEIIQLNSQVLEGKFYLLNTEDHQLYACRYQSTDQGETWQFVEQLSPEN